MKTLNLTLLCICLSCLGIAQTPYYLLDDFDSAQARFESIIEYDNHLYVGGMYIIPGDFERNIQLYKFDLDGKLINSIVWDNDLEDGVLNFLNSDAFSVTTDSTLLLNVVIASNLNESIIRVDKNLDSVELVTYFRSTEVEGITGGAQLLVDSLFAISVRSEFFKNYIGLYNLEQDSFSLLHMDQDSESFYSPVALLANGNFVNSVLWKGTRSLSGVSNEGLSEIFIQVFDRAFTEREVYSIGDNFSHVLISAVVNNRNNLVISALEGSKDNGDDWLTYVRPTLMELNKDYEVIWRKPIGDSTFYEQFDFFKAITLAVDGNGYVLVGRKERLPRSEFGSDGYIMRVDSLGNELWQIVTEDAYDEAYVELSDIVATSDGYYMAVGKRSDFNDDDPYPSRVQAVMIKFDDDGNIIERTSTSDDVSLSQLQISIYPNPASHKLTIASQENQELVCQLVDIQGRPVGSFVLGSGEQKVIDVEAYATGAYQLVIRTTDGQLLGTEQVVIGGGF